MVNKRRKAIIVHDRVHAEIVLEAAKEMGRDVVLLSPPNAIHYLGLPYMQRFVKGIKVPATVVWEYICDCNDSPGKAHQALMMGFKNVRYIGDDQFNSSLRDLASRFGATLLQDSFETLDLMYQEDPYQATIKWLQ